MDNDKKKVEEGVKKGVEEALREVGLIGSGKHQDKTGENLPKIINALKRGAKVKERQEKAKDEMDKEIESEEDKTEEREVEEMDEEEKKTEEVKNKVTDGQVEPEQEKDRGKDTKEDGAKDEEDSKRGSQVLGSLIEVLKGGVEEEGETPEKNKEIKPGRRPEGEGKGGEKSDKEERGADGDEEGKTISYVFEEVNKSEATDLPEMSWEPGTKVLGTEEEEEEDLKKVDEYYSLIPKNPNPEENIYAYAHITWDDGKDSLVYRVVEPNLSDKDEELLEKIKGLIQDRLDVNLEDLGKIKAKGYLSEKLDEALEILDEEPTGMRKEAIRYYLERDLIDMERIEPFMRDPNIEEISCDGVDIPIFVYHRNAEYGSMETNVRFDDKQELDTYVRRLGQIVGKTLSMANPLVDASLPDGSRLQATLGTDIARKGSNFTIRKFTENPLTPVDLIDFGTVDPRVLAYLWLAIEHQNSVLVSGGTATGKTTMLNVISLFIKPEMKIVTIEDTAELRLPHDHWVPEVAREAIAEKGSDTVDMFTLLKESLRQRPDYIVVGEVRGAEAFVLFQQMSTGHPGLATIHAENPERLISRLTTKPIDLPPSLLSSLDIVVFLRKVRKGDSLLRKIDQIVEIKRFSREENIPKMNRVFKWNAAEDQLINENPSMILEEISTLQNIGKGEIKREVEERAEVFEWMVHEGIRDLDKIGKIFSKYYSDKDSLMKKINKTG